MQRFQLLRLLAVFLPCLATAGSTSALETIFVVRHAEKATPWQEQVEDFRPLSSQGQLRAQTIAKRLADAGIDGIYSSPTARTVQTAMPLALALELEVQADADTLERRSLRSFFNRLRRKHRDDSAVLVVGHSNTIPDLLQALGANRTCFERLGLVPHPKYGHLIEGYEGLWEVELSSPGCRGMRRRTLSLPGEKPTGAPPLEAPPGGDPETAEPGDLEVPLAPRHLQPFEATYRILYGGQSMGVARHSLRREGSRWTLIQTTEIPRAQINQRSELRLEGSALEPKQLKLGGKLGPSTSEAFLAWHRAGPSASVLDRRLRIQGHSNFPRSRKRPQGRIDIDRPWPAGTFEKNTLPMLLPAMSLVRGKGFALNRYTVEEDDLRAMKAAVFLEKNVEVPAGTFPALRVELSGGDEPLTAWIRATAPRRLLKLELGKKKWKWVLVKEDVLVEEKAPTKSSTRGATMPQKIDKPTRVEAAGNIPKLIDEYVGRVNTGDENVSIALMQSPEGWEEPGQRPEFDEYTLVLDGKMFVEHEGGTLEVGAGEGVIARAGEWIRYSTPGGARYVAVCLPAFSPDTVHRDE